jgi:hypothetical protein
LSVTRRNHEVDQGLAAAASVGQRFVWPFDGAGKARFVGTRHGG